MTAVGCSPAISSLPRGVGSLDKSTVPVEILSPCRSVSQLRQSCPVLAALVPGSLICRGHQSVQEGCCRCTSSCISCKCGFRHLSRYLDPLFGRPRKSVDYVLNTAQMATSVYVAQTRHAREWYVLPYYKPCCMSLAPPPFPCRPGGGPFPSGSRYGSSHNRWCICPILFIVMLDCAPAGGFHCHGRTALRETWVSPRLNTKGVGAWQIRSGRRQLHRWTIGVNKIS